MQHWRTFAVGTLASFAAAAAGISYGWLVKKAGDTLQGGMVAGSAIEPTVFVWLLIGIVIAALIRACGIYVSTVFNNQAVQNGLVGVQSSLFSSMLDGDLRDFYRLGAGPYVSRFVHDIEAIRLSSLRLVTNCTKSLLTILGACALMFALDWQLFLLILAVYPLAFGPVQLLGKRIRSSARRVQEQMGEMSTLLTETAQSVRFFKAYNLEQSQKKRAKEQFERRSDLFLRRLKQKAAIDPLLEVVGGFVIAVILGFSAWRIASNASTVGDILGFITLIGLIAPEVRAMGSLMAVLQDGSAAASRIEALGEALETDESSEEQIGRATSISFDSVTFSHGQAQTVLSDVSFGAETGDWIAIMGPSGSGKSTLLDLLLGLYMPDSGSVLVDGRDVRSLDRTGLLTQFALVEQETVLLEDTISANLRLGAPTAPDEQLARLCRAVGLHDMIMRLPDGYATRLGPRGFSLSGGEARRLSLARALMRDAPVLILDEALTGTDKDTQAAILQHLQTVRSDKIIIQITHDPEQAGAADQIWSLRAGELASGGRDSPLDNHETKQSKTAHE